MPESEEAVVVKAAVGDRIVVRGAHLDEKVRNGEVVEVPHADGSPPYQVRWSDDGHTSLFFPGAGAAVVEHGAASAPE